MPDVSLSARSSIKARMSEPHRANAKQLGGKFSQVYQ